MRQESDFEPQGVELKGFLAECPAEHASAVRMLMPSWFIPAAVEVPFCENAAHPIELFAGCISWEGAFFFHGLADLIDIGDVVIGGEAASVGAGLGEQPWIVFGG